MTLHDVSDHTHDELRGMVRRGELVRLALGAYVDGDRWRAADVDQRYLLRVRATLSRRSGIAVVSHHSAAALHRLATLHPDRPRVHVSIDGRGGGKSTSTCIEHRVTLDDADCTSVDGLRVTTPARTALDLSCAGSPVQALCAVESALRLGADVAAALLRMGRRDGIARARTAVLQASPLTESIGESWSRALMMQWPEIPEPRLQHRFVDSTGRFVARSDFDWEGRLVGEFDGLMKYGDGASVVKEKLREDAIRALDVHVVRWTWPDLQDPRRLRRLLNEALARAFSEGGNNRGRIR